MTVRFDCYAKLTDRHPGNEVSDLKLQDRRSAEYDEKLNYPWEVIEAENPEAPDYEPTYYRVAIAVGRTRSDVAAPADWPSDGTTTVFDGEASERVDEQLVRVDLTDGDDRFDWVRLQVDERRLPSWLRERGADCAVAVNLAYDRLLMAELNRHTERQLAAVHRDADRSSPGVRTRWESALPQPSAVTTTDDALYVGGSDYVAAVDPDERRVLWRTDVDGTVQQGPVVSDGRVFVGAKRGHDEWSLAAVDAATGDPLWSRESEARIEMVAAEAGLLHVGFDGSVAAYDPASGERAWAVDVGNGKARWAPAAAGDSRYVATRDGGVYAVDADSGTVQWTFQTDRRFMGTPAVTEESVYVGSTGRTVYALDADTGAVEWSTTVGQVRSSPLLLGETLIVGGDRLHALDAETGAIEWVLDTDDRMSRNQPLLGDQTADGTVRGVRASGYRPADEREAGPDGEYVVYVTDGTAVYAVAAATGDCRWRRELVPQRHTLSLVDGAPHVVYETPRTPGAHLCALDPTDGSVRWTRAIADDVYAVRDGTAYVADESLLAVEPVAGTTTETTARLEALTGGQRSEARFALGDERSRSDAETGESLRLDRDRVPPHARFEGAAFEATVTLTSERLPRDDQRAVDDPITAFRATVDAVSDGVALLRLDARDGDREIGRLRVDPDRLPAGVSTAGDACEGSLRLVYDHATTRTTAFPEMDADRLRELFPVHVLPDATADEILAGGDSRPDAPDARARPTRTVDLGSELSAHPAVADGIVFAGGEEGPLVARDAETGAVEWTAGHDCRGLLLGDDLYVDAGQELYRYDPATGERRWRTAYDEWLRDLALTGETLAIRDSDGVVRGVDAATGRTEWSADPGDREYEFGRLAASEGTVYTTGRNVGVYAFDAVTGDLQWTHSVVDGFWGLAAVGDRAYATVENGDVLALDADGTRRWSYRLPKASKGSPTVFDGSVYVGCDDGRVYALDADTGEREWAFETSGRVEYGVAAADGVVAAQSRLGSVYALDAATGDPLWVYEGEDAPDAEPAVAGETVFAGDGERGLNVLSPPSDV